MTRAEAKRRVCHAAATLLDHGDAQGYLHTDLDGAELSEEDTRRMVEALDELVRELRRRGVVPAGEKA